MPLRRVPGRSLAALTLAGVLALAGCGSSGSDGSGSDGASSGGGAGGAAAQTINPYADRSGYADPTSKVAQAAAAAKKAGETDREQVFTRLAEIPQGIWLTPEEYPPGSVAGYVTSIVDGASAAGEVPTFVVYGIPDRDCSGGHSAGGLSADEYGPWVGEIAKAAGAASVPVSAILEPDALASLLDCGDRDQRVTLISDAADRLAAAGVTTYIDGGHSHWIDPQKIADLLEAAGVAEVRGFSTNVSNFQSDADEQAYAEQLSSLVGGAHYVIDTGRNGFGATDEWCNPPDRAFGTEPASVSGQGSLDAYLWIKPPGESDGDCHGGPAAGQFWPERTMELATASGW
ncbi:glycoside hydrolase family 6 protein [Nocardioides mangrovi]|uniref:Glucanase n=1 Tax=Nocardioides mangrovi TaxID=2874580 RepID=A0ABS7UJ91_9ACTN|nr:glycoside hydrolase family 6 protein [Nocardioides mangrovi]MBZ5740880.1 glycoside hydrolase family 6 protein [Nocardioides mangrovi]